ncbi:MAG: putative aminohydrolase SsnA [Clostridia bacterium]|nr:putative aminohydrolase SsnA [Clostridia bacterium]
MYLIGNGRMITRDRDKPFYENGAVLTDGAVIKRVGDYASLKSDYPTAELLDAGGGVIMPGLINAHAHLYSSLIAGYIPKDLFPGSHYENMCKRSWKLDRELGFYDVSAGAYAGIIGCIRNGVTTVFDHHASYKRVGGSLFAIAGAVKEAGIRGCLCYETSHRCGFGPCSEAIAENENFIGYAETAGDDRIKAMFGLHAPFTLSDIDISDSVRRNAGRTGFHIHVSEGTEDGSVCELNYGKTPVARLSELGAVTDKSILVHCIHTTEKELGLIASSGAFVVNCPQSNLSDAVGSAAVADMLKMGVKVGLGTDSFTFDMLESARALVLAERNRTGKCYVGLGEAAEALFENNRLLAETYFPKGIGSLREGAPADIIILGRKPPTAITAENFDSQLILGASGAECTMTMCAGRILMINRKIVSFDENEMCGRIKNAADALWTRLDSKKEESWLPPYSILESENS